MNTVFLVLAEFNSSEIQLNQVCEKHFGMSLPQAKRKAALHQLPVPFYKKSGKSGYFTTAIEWAEFIDKQRSEAKKEWQLMNK